MLLFFKDFNFFKVISVPNLGLELTTLRSEESRGLLIEQAKQPEVNVILNTLNQILF